MVLQTTGKRALLWGLCTEVKLYRQRHNDVPKHVSSPFEVVMCSSSFEMEGQPGAALRPVV